MVNRMNAMVECYRCGFYDCDCEQCTCNPADKWYACLVESRKPENVMALKDYAAGLSNKA